MIIKLTVPGLADSLVIPLENEIRELNKEIVDLNEQHTTEISNLTNLINDKDLLISQQEEQIANCNELIGNLNIEVEELNTTINDLNYLLSKTSVPKGTKYTYSDFTELPPLFKELLEQEENLMQALAYTSLTGELEMNLYNASNTVYMFLNSSAGSYYGYEFDYKNKLTKITITLFRPCACEGMFSGCRGLKEVNINGKCTGVKGMFSNCTDITKITGNLIIDTSDYSQMFYYCQNLKEIPDFVDFSKVTNAYGLLLYCESLNLKEWVLDMPNVTNVSYMFRRSNILKLDLLNCKLINDVFCLASETPIQSLKFDAISINRNINPFGNYSDYIAEYTFREVLIKNLGYCPNSNKTNLLGFHNLGLDNEEYPNARKNLLDTLITYSFDRASAGYSIHTIQISSRLADNPLSRLTDEEIALITAKGYTIA